VDYIAETAVSRAAVSQDQECRRPFFEAVADIRAVSRLADRMQVVKTQDFFHFGYERGFESRFFKHFFCHLLLH
jgi:hypothetical protein